MLILDDCLNVMNKMESQSIDLVYLDPPFFKQKKLVLKDREGNEYSFDDTWDSMEEYIEYLEVRIKEMKRVLKNTGSIFLHCDHSASHYLKIMMDRVFGINHFESEIIWSYKRWSNSKKGLLNSHQTILFYSKTPNFKFNVQYMDYSPTTNIDQILQDRVKNDDGKSTYKVNDNGEVVSTKEKKGVPLSDIWEIPFLNPKAKERVGYPTQKPILLLERIIKLCSDEGDFILDPFCGSGTTLVAAMLLDRKYIGFDKNEKAIELSECRIQNPIRSESNLINLGKEAYDNKNSYKKIILSNFDCNIVQRNKGIDAILKKRYNNSIVAIRIQKEDEELLTAINLLNKAAIKKNCSFSILIRTNSKSLYKNNDKPKNMFIIDSYQCLVEEIIDQQSEDIITQEILLA